MVQTKRFDFESVAGTLISGALDFPDEETLAYAIFAHCFTCTKSSLAASRISRSLADTGIATLRFDFTGLGQSEGEFADGSFSGSVEDLIAAAAAMTSAGRMPSLLIGHSLGGAAVLAAAGSLPEVKAVATIGAPIDVKHVTHLFSAGLEALLRDGEAEVNIGGRPFLLRRNFVDDLEKHDQRERVRNLKRPLLVLHAPKDMIVGIENAAAIFEAARHPKSFISLDDADHLILRLVDAEFAAQIIAAWASRYLDVRALSQ